MYEIIKTGATLLLQYQIDRGDAEWIDNELRNTGELHLRRTFTFSKYLSQEEVSILLPRDDYEPPSHETYYFLLGTLEGIYYKIESDILNTDHSVYILKDVDISIDFFCR